MSILLSSIATVLGLAAVINAMPAEEWLLPGKVDASRRHALAGIVMVTVAVALAVIAGKID